MTVSSDYIIIFTMGLFGSLHCIGMCGGLIMACSVKFAKGRAGFTIFYNAGRILSYALIGVLMGVLGKGALTSELFMLREVLPVVAGVVMIVIGLDILGILPLALKRRLSSILPRKAIDGFITRRLRSGRSPAFVLGILNGLIPCGLVYAAALKASTTGSPFSGAMVMASLGAGTLLPLLFVGTLTTKKLFVKGRVFSTISAVILIALGTKAIYFAVGVGKTAHMMHM